MQNREPTINAGGLTNDELYKWMLDKARAFSQLQAALAEKENMQQALAKLDKQITELTSAAALELEDTNQGSIHHR